MKLIRKARLYFEEGKSDKVYEVDLCRLGQGRYVVNFRYGRRGGKLREGTKTIEPIDRPSAEKIFTSVVVAKTNKGYREAGQKEQEVVEATVGSHADEPASEDNTRMAIETAILDRFETASQKGDLAGMRRSVWRIGELAIQRAVPRLLGLVPARDELMNYCVAWALGRCGDDQARPALNRLLAKTGSDAVKRIVWEALLASADEGQRTHLVDETIRKLSKPIQEALAAEDVGGLASVADQRILRGGPQGMDLLELLYRAGAVHLCAYRYVLSVLDRIPFKPGYFRAVRHIYKAAEFRQDAVVIGLLALRFEIDKARFSREGDSHYVYLPDSHDYVEFNDEVSQPHSRLAYSNRTRDYFRKRIWRMLRKLGEKGDPGYIDMAMAVLLPFNDRHAVAPKKIVRQEWQRDSDGRYRSRPVQTRRWGPFGGYVAFNHILYANSSRYRLSSNGLSWLEIEEPQSDGADSTSETGPAPRQEAFPQIWDGNPLALWRLLTNSRCEPVHSFAARALSDNTQFCSQLTLEDLKLLFFQPYADTIDLALTLVKSRYDPNQPDCELLEALLACHIEIARQTARRWIDDRQEMLLESAGLMCHILTSRHADVRQWGHLLVKNLDLTTDHVQGVIARTMVILMEADDQAEVHDPIIADMAALFLGPWQDSCSRMDLEVIADLLDHPLEALRVLAGKLLLQHHMPSGHIPPKIIRRLIESESAQLQGIGVQLFSRLPVEWLLAQADLIFSFCTSEEMSVRQAALPMVQKLARQNTDFGHDLFERLFPLVFRKAPSVEFRQDLVNLLTTGLEEQALALDSGTIWRLLQARASGARQVGVHLLAKTEPQQFTIRQWARLGNHALLAARQWSWQVYGDHWDHIVQHMSEGLRLLDSDWKDTRQFAMGYFRDRFEARHWTPNLLVGICDSIREDVQRFGRELMTTFFDEAHGPEYLLKLSQHPTAHVQLFASNLLEDYAGGDLARVERLLPYFITVLSQVNCGRVAKARIFKFLHRIVLESEEGASLVAPIFNRTSATMAIGDRAACVEILREINRSYPQVNTLLEPVPVPLKTHPGLGG